MPLRIVANGVVTRSVRDTAAFYREMEKVSSNPKLPAIGDVTHPATQRLQIAVCTQSIAREASPEVRARIIDSSSPGFGFFRLSFESLKSALIDASMLTGRRGRRGVRPVGREHPRLHPDHDGRYRPPRLTSTTKSVAPAQ